MEVSTPFVREDFTDCIQCGLCLEACPTYRETFEEGLSARGRIQLVRDLACGRMSPANPNPLALDLCLMCCACETACPSGVRYHDLLVKARAWLPQARRERSARRLRGALRFLFLHPRILAFVLRTARWMSRSRLAVPAVRLFCRRENQQHFLDLADSLSLPAQGASAASRKPSAGGAVPSPASTRSVVEGAADSAGPAAAGAAEAVLIFKGCATPVLFPQVFTALEALLERLGVAYVYPRGQVCCGALLLHHGDVDAARVLARKNVAAFARGGSGPILVEAAGCGAMLKAYAELLCDAPADAERAQSFSARVRDVTEYLAERLGPLPSASGESAPAADSPPSPRAGAPAAVRVAYQDPCHLRHRQGVTAEPRSLLDALPGIQRVETGEEDLCCGSAGIYNLLEPEMSACLARRKVAVLSASGAQIVATANPGCRLQLAGRLRRAGIAMEHIVEICERHWAGARRIPENRGDGGGDSC